MSREQGAFTSDNPSLSLPILQVDASVAGIHCRAINCKSDDVEPCVLQLIAKSVGPDVSLYLHASLAESTKKAYRSDISAFLGWGGTVPSTAAIIAQYLAECATMLSPVTLHRRVIALGKAHAAQGYDDPTKDEPVRAVLRGIRRIHGMPQRQAAPLLREDLLMLVDALPASIIGARDRALLLMGFAGGFRRSELVGLRVEDVSFVSEGMVVVLRRSKTDQEGQGRKVGIPHGRTRACPVKALRAWLDQSAITNGPIFRSVSKWGHIAADALTDQVVSLVLRKCAGRAGFSCERLSGHSLRSGLVTSAAKAGVSSWKIRQQTGHRSDAMLQRYIRDADIFTENAAGALL